MQTLVGGLVAAFVGIVVGFWLRSTLAKTEKGQLAQRNSELVAEVALVRGELSRAMAESAAKAGFESLATERLTAMNRLASDLAVANQRANDKDAEILRLTDENSKLGTNLGNEQNNGERLVQQFKVLASEILKENSTVFTAQNKETLGHLLNPLTRDLNEFRVKVEEVKSESLVGRTQLSDQLKSLESLNKKLSDEAHNLATALRRDTQAQGNWGEIILLDILENSGLRKGDHFTFQESFNEEDAEGNAGPRRRTDIVVKLPEGRHLILDSKVSINAYNDSVKAETETDRNQAIKRHMASIRTHYTDLAARNYHRLAGIQSPDFVVMFVPIEPAFMVALQQDDGLWQDAYQKGVLLAGPTTVLFVIRIVEDLWRKERQVRNVKDIMRRGTALYDKFVGFVTDMEKIGKNLVGAKDVYDDAMGKLKTGDGNLIRQVEILKQLGVRSTKTIPRNLLDSAEVDDHVLSIAVEASENTAIKLPS